MSNCLLNIVAQHLRFYYAVAESVKNSRDVVFIVLAGKPKIVDSWSEGMTSIDYVELMAGIAVGGHGIHCFFTLQSNFFSAGFIRSY